MSRADRPRTRSRRARVIAAVAAVAITAVAAGCSTGQDGDDVPPPSRTASVTPTAATEPPGQGLDRFYTQDLSWQGCSEDGDGMECATLVVPLDYTDPDGATVNIAIDRLPATGDRIGSLVVNPGGPGASGVEYARGGEGVASPEVLARYDLVGFDPRGTGSSDPIDCISDKQLDETLAIDGSPDDATEVADLDEVAAALADGCETHAGDLIAHMSTEDVARDLDVLRGALGDETLTYIGKSYGTFIGAVYAGLFPSKVGHLVLDGAVDPAMDVKASMLAQAQAFDKALAAFVRDCQRIPDCPVGTGKVADGVQQVADFLDQADSEPLQVGDRELTQSLALLGIAYTLYDRQNGWPALRLVLEAAFGGDGGPLMKMSDGYTERNSDGTYATNIDESIYAVTCVDHGAQPGLDTIASWLPEFEATAPIFGTYVAYGNLTCAHWPVSPAIDPGPIAAAGAAPILVVGTTRDPATPYAQAQALADELDSGVLLTYDGDGHTAYRKGSTCIDDAVDAYLIDGTVPDEGSTC